MVNKKTQPANKKDRLWIEAKQRCRLNTDEIRMAKTLGLNPRNLIKNIPSQSQPWKLPVKVWIRELYQKRRQKTAITKTCRESTASSDRVADPAPLPQDSLTCAEEEDSFDALDSHQIQKEDQAMLRRQEQFRMAARYIAEGLSELPHVRKIVLFGSVAKPLEKEVPRFPKFRRAGIAIGHECRDVDIAVWVSDLSGLRIIRKACSRVLNNLLAEKQAGVANHQVDIFMMEPVTNRYMGRLCTFSACSRGKDTCHVPGCGKIKFLRQHGDFIFDVGQLDDPACVILFDTLEDSKDTKSPEQQKDVMI